MQDFFFELSFELGYLRLQDETFVDSGQFDKIEAHYDDVDILAQVPQLEDSQTRLFDELRPSLARLEAGDLSEIPIELLGTPEFAQYRQWKLLGLRKKLQMRHEDLWQRYQKELK
jgi:hypothetical protein